LRGALNDFLKVTMTDEFVAENITWREGHNKLHFRESAISRAFFSNYSDYNFFSIIDSILILS